MSHTSNCVRMLMMLNSRGLVKTKELAETLEVSERMVRKYKLDLEMAGFPINTKPGRYGGYYLDQKSFLPNIDFEPNEIVALDMAYDYVEKSHDFPEKAKFKRLYHHISSMSLYKEEADQYLYFIHKTRPSDTLTKGNELFLQLRSAVIEQKKVVISYQGWRGQLETRKIHPYGLINYDNSWYCCGFCEKRQKQRTFKLMRIQELTETEEHFERDKSFDIREDKLGIFNDAHHIELQIFPPFSYTIAESIWGEKQEITHNEDGSVYFKAKMFGKEVIVKWILSMGSGVKVIESAEIRDLVKKELIKSLDFY